MVIRASFTSKHRSIPSLFDHADKAEEVPSTYQASTPIDESTQYHQYSLFDLIEINKTKQEQNFFTKQKSKNRVFTSNNVIDFTSMKRKFVHTRSLNPIYNYKKSNVLSINTKILIAPEFKSYNQLELFDNFEKNKLTKIYFFNVMKKREYMLNVSIRRIIETYYDDKSINLKTQPSKDMLLNAVNMLSKKRCYFASQILTSNLSHLKFISDSNNLIIDTIIRVVSSKIIAPPQSATPSQGVDTPSKVTLTVKS